jgi:possible glucokinase
MNLFFTDIYNKRKRVIMKIGIDLGGSHIGVGVIDNKNFIVEKVEKRLLAKDKKDIKNIIESYIIKNVKEFSSKYKITEIGIAVPGTIKKEQILKSVNLGVKEYNLVENLKKEIQLPIKIRNDAKCAALAENTIGSLKDYKRSLFLTLGTGIGGAVIINDKLLDTGDLPGCEFGHMVIQRDGIKCNCGKQGCFEKYASMKALKTNLRQILGVDEKIRGQELLDIIRKNPKDEKINKVIDEYIEYLSIGISNLINIFEPEAIGIGGSFVYFSDVLLDRLIQNIIKKQYLFNKREELIIIPAALGNDAGIIGSVM